MDWKQEVFKRIDAIAEKLGVTAQYLWGVLVKQGYGQGNVDIGVGVLLALAVLGCLALFRKGVSDEEMPGDTAEICTFVGLVGAAVSGVVSTFFLYDGIITRMNPEYYAFRKLMELIGK